jgi:GxxExxY protein
LRYKDVSRASITSQIIGAAIKVHRNLEPGLPESGCEACLAYEIERLGLQEQRQKAVPLIYGKVQLACGFRADLVVDGSVVVEIKGKALHPVTMRTCSLPCACRTSPSASRSTFTSSN